MNITQFLLQRGWHQGFGADFYLPQNHPHLHLGLRNSADLREIGQPNTHENILQAYANSTYNFRFLAISDGNGRSVRFVNNGDHTYQMERNRREELFGQFSKVEGINADDLIPLWRVEMEYISSAYGID